MSTTAVEAAYLTLQPGTGVRTVQGSSSVLVDVDAAGRIVGVEQIGGPVDMATLAEVLRTVRL